MRRCDGSVQSSFSGMIQAGQQILQVDNVKVNRRCAAPGYAADEAFRSHSMIAQCCSW